jgi:glycosyltransferase involved in cell wall biosynthesis
MKIALVASSALPRPGALERHVNDLARALARRGAEVEVLTQDASRRLPRVSTLDGAIVRRFLLPMGAGHGAVAPGLWEHLRRTAQSFDVAHIHTPHAPFAAAVMGVGPRGKVFTPHAPVKLLVRWPYLRVMRAVVDHAALTLCASSMEGGLLAGRFPAAAGRISGLAAGVDAEAIATAAPFDHPGVVVLAVGRLERHNRVNRVIAAMASLGPAYQLVIVGAGPAARRLAAHAEDLCVHARVKFVAPPPEARRYRWLRTARVLVALAEHATSGIEVTEALSAGVPVVASDIPVHREAAARAGGPAVVFVSPEGSPLEVADAITAAARLRAVLPAPGSVPSWDAVADATLTLYEGAGRRRRRSNGGGIDPAQGVRWAVDR